MSSNRIEVKEVTLSYGLINHQYHKFSTVADAIIFLENKIQGRKKVEVTVSTVFEGTDTDAAFKNFNDKRDIVVKYLNHLLEQYRVIGLV